MSSSLTVTGQSTPGSYPSKPVSPAAPFRFSILDSGKSDFLRFREPEMPRLLWRKSLREPENFPPRPFRGSSGVPESDCLRKMAAGVPGEKVAWPPQRGSTRRRIRKLATPLGRQQPRCARARKRHLPACAGCAACPSAPACQRTSPHSFVSVIN